MLGIQEWQRSDWLKQQGTERFFCFILFLPSIKEMKAEGRWELAAEHIEHYKAV